MTSACLTNATAETATPSRCYVERDLTTHASRWSEARASLSSMKHKLSVALALQETHTLSSDWIWGDEILARGLSKYLNQSYDCQLVDGADCQALSNQERFDVAIYF